MIHFRSQWLLLVCALLTLSTLIGIRAYTEHARIEREELQRMEAQAQMIEAAVGRQFRAANQVLESIRTTLPSWQSGDTHSKAEGNRDLATLSDAMLFVRTLLVLDAQGTIILSNRPQVIGQNFAQRDYFRVVSEQQRIDLLYVTPPFKSVLGTYTMNLSRMLPNADGKFDGVAAASLDGKEFEILLNAARYAPDVELHLAHQNNKIFVSAPPQPDSQANSLAPLAATQFGLQRNLALAGLTSDNVMQLQLSRQRDQVFAAWQDRLKTEVQLVVLLATLAVLGLLVYQRRQQLYDDRMAANAEVLRASEERHRMTVEAIAVGVMDVNPESGEIRCDAHWYEMLGFAPDAFPLTVEQWFFLIHPDDAGDARAAFEAMLASTQTCSVEFRIRDKRESWHWVIAHGRTVAWSLGKPSRLIITQLDINERKRVSNLLRSSEERLRTLLCSMQDLVFFIDTAGNFVEYYAPHGRVDYLAAGRVMNGCSFASVLPESLANLLQTAILDVMSEDKPKEFDFSLMTGSDPEPAVRHFNCSLSGVNSIGKVGSSFPIGFLGVIRDVTELHEAVQTIRTMAFHDPLTHLPNRRLLMDRLIQKLAGCQRSRNHGALMFLDLDRFKALNDTHGHDAGDQLLIEVAKRLQARVRTEDTVARLGGDEFVVMLTALGEDAADARTEAANIAEQIRLSLQLPFALTDGNDQTPLRWNCSSSIGIRVFGGTAEAESTPLAGAERVLKDADNAMYAAKTAGRNLVRLAE